MRREKCRKKRLSPVDQQIIGCVADEPESHELEDDIAQLYRFINQLDELNRALILLYLGDRTYAEIAATLGISRSNVTTKIRRIKQQLRRDFHAAESQS